VAVLDNLNRASQVSDSLKDRWEDSGSKTQVQHQDSAALVAVAWVNQILQDLWEVALVQVVSLDKLKIHLSHLEVIKEQISEARLKISLSVALQCSNNNPAKDYSGQQTLQALEE
jgi:hypothetical protein